MTMIIEKPHDQAPHNRRLTREVLSNSAAIIIRSSTTHGFLQKDIHKSMNDAGEQVHHNLIN